VTKDRPRNRPGNAGKQGRFGGSGPGGDRQRPRGERGHDSGEGRSARGTGEDKPWSKGQRFNKPAGRPRHQERREATFEENGETWIWGLHAAGAALANPMRKISRALISPTAAARVGLDPNALPKFAELLEPRDIDERLPPGAVHQGLAVRCRALDGLDITEAAMRPEQALAILDQVTDPQNVGAIFRSAAAFGVGGIVMQTRNAPVAGGALAKAAAGAVEVVPEIRAVNISRAIDVLRDAGWKVIGLDGTAQLTLDQAVAGREPVAIVMGAEGSGLRQGVAKSCSVLARIPMQPGMESLNVSNAAAIALYELARPK
jgi:23S rRNA (guanosine2251-2'-O)-methyltransferase